MLNTPQSLLFASVATSLVLVISVQAQEILFPDEVSKCLRGRCVPIRQCPSVLQHYHLNPPVVCRMEESLPIVCCLDPTDGPAPVQDISPPSVNFQCGVTPESEPEPPFKRKKRQIVPPTANPETTSTSFPDLGTADPSSIPHDGIDGAVGIGGAVGATPSTKDAWPWMALLGNRNRLGDINWFCAGVVINELWILTAAHCFQNVQPNVVRLGEHDHSDDNDGALHEDFSLAEVIPYPEYTRAQGYHDLALIRLDRQVRLKENINPVCLPWGFKSNENITDTYVILTGWGDTEFEGYPSPVLQEVTLTVFPSSQCDENYRKLLGFHQTWPQGIGEETVCAGYPFGGRDACQGDSGGPIVSNTFSSGPYYLDGIVSRGYGCGLAEYPGLYANVRYPPYLAWIKRTAF